MHVKPIEILARSAVLLAVDCSSNPTQGSLLSQRTGQEKPMPPHLLTRAKENLCGLIQAALSSDTSAKSCSSFRKKNGDLLIDVVMADGKDVVRIIRDGQRCTGGYLGVDKRPGRKVRELAYIELTFGFVDDQTMEFEGWLTMYALLPDGRNSGEIGTCNPKVAGRVRLSDGRWRRAGKPEKGCSE